MRKFTTRVFRDAIVGISLAATSPPARQAEYAPSKTSLRAGAEAHTNLETLQCE